MPKFRKKPVVIEAMRYTGDNLDKVVKWVGNLGASGGPAGLQIETLEGPLHASQGDWIIKGIEGEFYPCKDGIFRKTYEPVERVIQPPDGLGRKEN